MYIEVNKREWDGFECRLLIKGKCFKDGRTEKGQTLVRDESKK